MYLNITHALTFHNKIQNNIHYEIKLNMNFCLRAGLIFIII